MKLLVGYEYCYHEKCEQTTPVGGNFAEKSYKYQNKLWQS